MEVLARYGTPEHQERLVGRAQAIVHILLHGGRGEPVECAAGHQHGNLDVSEAIDAIDAFLCGQEP
jgi:hypothetical protein